MGDFIDDKERSDRDEILFIPRIIKKMVSNVESYSRCKNSDYDFMLNFDKGGSITFEHKKDYGSEETGNAWIETDSIRRGKSVESGLPVTKSDYWAHEVWLDGKWKTFIIESEELKRMTLKMGADGRMVLDVVYRPESNDGLRWNKKVDGYNIPSHGFLLNIRNRLLKEPWLCVEDISDRSWNPK